MADYGVATQSALAQLNFYSPNANANFLRETGTYLDSYNPVAGGFSQLSSIVTPIQGSMDARSSTLGGSPKTNGGYAAPFRTIIQGNTTFFPTGFGGYYHWGWRDVDPSDIAYWIPTAQTAAIDYKLFGKLNTPPSSSYGFKAYSGFNDNVAIDEEYKSVYLHRTSTGDTIRSGVSRNLPAIQNSRITPDFSEFYNVEPNVFFDRPFDKPPIIAIWASTGSVGNSQTPQPVDLWPVALHSFQKNAEGKYVSASVVSPRELGTWSYFGQTSVGYSVARTTPFFYLIFSDEEPLYGADSSAYGLKINNSFGETVFDSKYTVVDTNYLNLIAKPRSQWDDVNPGYTSVNNQGFTTDQFAYPVLNDFMSVTGRMYYTTFFLATSPNNLRFGAVSFPGRYLAVWIRFLDDGSGTVTSNTPRVREFFTLGMVSTTDNQAMTFDGPTTSDSYTWERRRFSVEYHLAEDTGFSIKVMVV